MLEIKKTRPHHGWRSRLFLLIEALATMGDGLICVFSGTYFNSNLRQSWLLSDMAEKLDG